MASEENICENIIDKTTMKKMSMSSNAKEFVPKVKMSGDDLATINGSDDAESKLERISPDEENKIDVECPFTDAGYESHFSCGVNECEVGVSEETYNVPHNRPTSLHVSAIIDNTLYHSMAINNTTLYALEPTTASHGLYGTDSSSLAYTHIDNPDHIEYVSPSVFQTSSTSPVIVQQAVPPNIGIFQSYHHSGGSSPHSYQSVSPPIITSTNNGTSTTIGGEHYVMVHVNLGETFSIRVGDQIQNISGPATVRMVSNSGPPTPMPMQVPPGHMVQQIVDENGILTHVILSPLHQPTQCLGPSHIHQSNQQSSFYPSNQNNGNLPIYPNNYNMYNNGTNMSQSPNVNYSQGVVSTINSNIDSLPDHTNKSRIDRTGKEKSNNSDFSTSQSNTRPLNNYNDSKHRTIKSRGHQYHHPSQADENNHYSKTRTSHTVSSLNADIGMQDAGHQDKSIISSGYINHTHYSKIRKKRSFTNSASANTKHHYNQDQASSPASSADEATTILTDEEKKAISDVLNTIKQPEVSEIEARSALIQIIAPTSPENCVATINPSDFTFQLHFAERNPDSRYNCVFYGEAVEISLQDLKPATVYYVKVCCIYENITGNLSQANKFTTSTSEPCAPKPVQLQTKTRNTVQIKWSAPTENGSKITEYVVEYCRADSNTENYTTGYRGNAKTCKVSKLKPSSEYLFKLAAINSNGQSAWSDCLAIITSGTAPLPPDPPTMARADIGGLLLTWKKRPSDETFCLEMMDEATGYGFITVFNGPEVEHYVENLRRNTSYRFHLAASNQDGRSKWSEVVTISTKPDLPSPPQKLHVRGKINPTYFVLVWDHPEDDGGLPVTSYKLELDITSTDITDNESDRDWVLFYEGFEREYQCKSLVPGSFVLARVSAKSSSGGCGSPCTPINIRLAAMSPCQMSPPRKDIGIKTKSGQFTPGGINLLWETPENDGGSPITTYELCQWLLKSKSKVSQNSSPNGNIVLEEYLEEFEEQMVYSGTQLHCQITGLIPGAQYRYRIRASNKAGYGKWSYNLDATSGPSAPEGLSEAPTVIHRSVHVANVSWLPPVQSNGSQIIEYHLEMKHTLDKNGEYQLIYMGPNLSYEVKNLNPDSCYKFRVEAINRAGNSPYSPICEYTTPPSVPCQVVNVHTDLITMHSIKLSWKEPDANGSFIINYIIEVTNCNPANFIPSAGCMSNYFNLQDTLSLSSESTDKVITDLLPDTNYKFRVQAINGVGSGPFSSIIKAATLIPPPAPPRLECLNVQSNSIKLRWYNDFSARNYYISRLYGCTSTLDKSHTINEGNISQYQLQMSRQPDAGWSNMYTGTLQFHKLGKLLESTSYYFRIMASNAIGDGDFSDPYLIVTEKAVPSPVRAPKVVEVTMDSCSIEWPAVRSMNYDPIVYILQLLTISEKDCDYRQVYRGSETVCRLNNLMPGTEYMTRVCAVRLCSPSTIESEKTFDSPSRHTKNIRELGKSEKASVKLKDNSSPVTELLGAFSKSVTFSTLNSLNARLSSSGLSATNNISSNLDKSSGPSSRSKVRLPPFISRWLEINFGPWTDKHFIMLLLLVFTIFVLVIANLLQTYLK